jgi:hypothetical protein
MKSIAFFVSALLLLNACILGGLEKTTVETRDEVRATREVSVFGNHWQTCINPELKMNPTRVSACKASLVELPESSLASSLGLPQPVFGTETVVRLFGNVSLDLPNVMYVGLPESAHFALKISPVDRHFYDVIRMAVSQKTSEISLQSMRPGITLEEKSKLRDAASRIMLVGTAVFGAVNLDAFNSELHSLHKQWEDKKLSVSHYQTSANTLVAGLPQILAENERNTAAEDLRTMVKNVSLDQPKVFQLNSLIELRLRVP